MNKTTNEPVAFVRTWHKNGDQHAELDDWGLGLEALPDGIHNLFAHPPVPTAQTEKTMDLSGRGAEMSKKLKSTVNQVAQHHAIGNRQGVIDGTCFPMQEIFALIDEVCVGIDSPQPKEPEQGPVGEAYLCDRCHTPFDMNWECPSCGHNMATKEPVYTTPPQRTAAVGEDTCRAWVGLTDDELNEIVGSFDYRHDVAKAVEAKLKAKNSL